MFLENRAKIEETADQFDNVTVLMGVNLNEETIKMEKEHKNICEKCAESWKHPQGRRSKSDDRLPCFYVILEHVRMNLKKWVKV